MSCYGVHMTFHEDPDLLRDRLFYYDCRIADALARTWDYSDSDITVSTRLAAEHLDMSPAEVHRILEVWTLCSGRTVTRRALDRLTEES